MSGFLNIFESHQSKTARKVSQIADLLMIRSDRAKTEAAQNREELGTLTILVAAMLRALLDKGIVTQDEILARIAAVDAADGIQDGRVTPAGLRSILGIPEPPARKERSWKGTIAERAVRKNND